MQINERLAVRLARVKKRHKSKFVPRHLSMIVGPNHVARVNVSRNAFFSSCSEKKNEFSLTLILW